MKRVAEGIVFLCGFVAQFCLASAPHPRLHLDSARLTAMQTKAAGGAGDYLALKAYVDRVLQSSPSQISDPTGAVLGAAALFLAAGDATYRDGALGIYDWFASNRRLGSGWPGASTNPLVAAGDDAALLEFADQVYMFAVATDWLYDSLGSARLSTAQGFLQEYCEAGLGAGEFTFRAGSPWSAGAVKWMAVLGASGLCMQPGEPWDGYVQDARDGLQVWMDQICERFAEGGGSVEGTGFGRFQLNVTRTADMLATAAGLDPVRKCNRYFGKRISYLLGQFSWWDIGQGLFPFRSGDFKEDATEPGYDGFDDEYEEILLLMRWGGESEARRAAFAIDRLEMGPVAESRLYEEFCYRDASVIPELEAEVPLSRWTSGTGEVTARTSWRSKTDPLAALFCGDHRSNRMHLDQNSVQLNGYGGQLLIDSGENDLLSDAATDGYTARTVAHNTILIRDVSESFQDLKVEKSYPPDGGQRGFSGGDGPDLKSMNAFRQNKLVYNTADILRYEEGEAYTYALGDATGSYNNDGYTAPPPGNMPKCVMFQREFVFLRHVTRDSESYLVLFDRVEVPVERREQLRVASLFHFLNEPTVNGTPVKIAGSGHGGIWRHTGATLAIATDTKAKAFLRTLLPRDAVVTKIGGRGFEQYSDGKNYPSESTYGRWRIEIESPLRSSQTCFLAVAMPDDAARRRAVKTDVLQAEGDMAGVFIRNQGTNWILAFSKRTDRQPPSLPIRYRYTPSTFQRNLVFDLVPGGAYSVEAIDVGDTKVVQINAGGPYTATKAGVLAFDLPKSGSGADTTPPSGLVTINGGGSYTSTPAILLMLSASDQQSGLMPGGMFSVSNDNQTWSQPVPYTTLGRWLLSSGDGGKTVYVKFKDAAGNWSAPATDTVVLSSSGTPTDPTAPSGTLTINGGAATTENPAVDLAITASDLESGIGPVSSMQLSNDGLSWSQPEPYFSTKRWYLTDGKGVRTVFARVSDQAGNWSPVFSATIVCQ
ncbi:MAG: heparinase II/III family protein [Acidobacteria bacterium]|nr:heparinase II/III family protein [Acidobacteriota bacterium]